MTANSNPDHVDDGDLIPGAPPEGKRWCPACHGYGSSLTETAARCTSCGGSGLIEATAGGGGRS